MVRCQKLGGRPIDGRSSIWRVTGRVSSEWGRGDDDLRISSGSDRGFRVEPSLGASGDDLLMSGFDRFDISVPAGRRPIGRKFGAAADHGAAWAYGPEAPSTAFIGNDARTQAKAAIVAGPDRQLLEIRVSTRWS